MFSKISVFTRVIFLKIWIFNILNSCENVLFIFKSHTVAGFTELLV